MYLLHYTSQDAPGSESWSVYVEGYHDAQTDVPIDGSQRWVSSHPSEAEADAEARRLQAAVNI